MNVTKMLPIASLVFATALIACAASTDEDPAESRSDALQIGSTSTVKSIRDLEADGYTCRNWGGTTVTECTKFGSPTYTCDAAGRCTVLRTSPTPTWPPIVGPTPTVVAP